MRRFIGQRRPCWRRPGSRPRSSRCACPAPGSPSAWPASPAAPCRPAAASRTARRGSFPVRELSAGLLVARPAAGQAGEHGRGYFRLRSLQLGQERRRLLQPAAGDVLGDDRDAVSGRGPRQTPFDLALLPRRGNACRAAAAAAVEPHRASQRSACTSWCCSKRRDGCLRRPRHRRRLGQRQQRRQAHLRVAIVQRAASTPGSRRSRTRRAASTCTALRRTPAEGCLSARQRSLRRCFRRRLRRSDQFERPQRVHRCRRSGRSRRSPGPSPARPAPARRPSCPARPAAAGRAAARTCCRS